MKTLIINGSPRKNGDTEVLINEFVKHLKGDVKIVGWKDNISPCIDCRWCWDKPGCGLKDGMQAVYDYLEECDNVVLASPIWFSSLSGPLLDIASRFQTLFAARFFRREAMPASKQGVIFLTGGQAGTEEQPEKSAYIILRNMGVLKQNIEVIKSMDTDNLPAKADTAALARAREAAGRLNAAYNTKEVNGK